MRTCVQLKNSNREALPIGFQNDDVRYSESLVEYFLKEFTQENDLVFDPFAGFGTTLFVAEEMGRRPLGVEYDEQRVQHIQSQLQQPEKIIHGDSRQLNSYNLPKIHFSITSPPYMGKHDVENPFTAYTKSGKGYAEYLKDIQNIYKQIAKIMLPNARAVVEVANIKQNDHVTTLAWDIAEEISQVLHFEGEIIINWDDYGYGYTHSYCLIFRKSV